MLEKSKLKFELLLTLHYKPNNYFPNTRREIYANKNEFYILTYWNENGFERCHKSLINFRIKRLYKFLQECVKDKNFDYIEKSYIINNII